MKRLIVLSIVWALIFTMSPFSVVDDVQAVTIGDSCDAPESSSQKSVKLLFSTKKAWDADDGDIYCKIIDSKSTAVTYEDLRTFFHTLGILDSMIDGFVMRKEGTNVEGKCANLLIGAHANEKFNFDQDLEDIQIVFKSTDQFDCTVGISEPGALPMIEPNTPIRYRLEIPANGVTPQTDYYVYFKSVTNGKDPATSINCQCRIASDTSLSPIPGLTSEQSCLSASGNPIAYDDSTVQVSECVWTEIKKPDTSSDNTYSPASTLPTSAELSQKLNPLGTFTPQQLLGRIIKSVLGILGSIALVIFLYGGIMWMISMGSSDKIQKSLSTLVWGALGVIVILASYSIVSFVLENIPK